MSSTDSDAGQATAVNPEGAPSEERGRARRQTSRVVPHLSVAERVARGRAARAEVPRSSHAEFDPAAHRADPVALLEQQAETRVPELVPIRLRADAGLAVHVLPGRGAAHGGRPGRDARVGAAGAAVRGRAPVELRRVRLAGAAAGVRRQRLRRDAAGAVGVGCQAAGGEPGGGRPGQRLPPQGSAARSCVAAVGGYRDGDAASSPAMPNLDVWYAHLDVEELIGRAPRRRSRRRGSSAPRRALAKARTTRQHAGASPSSPTWSTASRGSSATRR